MPAIGETHGKCVLQMVLDSGPGILIRRLQRTRIKEDDLLRDGYRQSRAEALSKYGRADGIYNEAVGSGGDAFGCTNLNSG